MWQAWDGGYCGYVTCSLEQSASGLPCSSDVSPLSALSSSILAAPSNTYCCNGQAVQAVVLAGDCAATCASHAAIHMHKALLTQGLTQG